MVRLVGLGVDLNIKVKCFVNKFVIFLLKFFFDVNELRKMDNYFLLNYLRLVKKEIL